MLRLYTENVSGRQVGLYLVKQVVDRNNGEIEVESELGKGTDFRIYLKMDKKNSSTITGILGRFHRFEYG